MSEGPRARCPLISPARPGSIQRDCTVPQSAILAVPLVVPQWYWKVMKYPCLSGTPPAIPRTEDSSAKARRVLGMSL